MSNRMSRISMFVLAVLLVNGCATPQEQEVATQQSVGLAIFETSPSSLTGRYAEKGNEISFRVTRDGACESFAVWRSTGEPLLRVAQCPHGDSLDLGTTFHAAGPSGSLMSGALVVKSADLSGLLMDPGFALIPALVTDLGPASLAVNCSDFFFQLSCLLSHLVAFVSCSAGDNCCVMRTVGRACAECEGLHCP